MDRTDTESDWDSFLAGFPESEPRYALYNFEYTNEGRFRYAFLQWSSISLFHWPTQKSKWQDDLYSLVPVRVLSRQVAMIWY